MMAFEITVEDVELAVGCNTKRAQHIFDNIDLDAVEKAALRGIDMDEKTEYAYDEIRTLAAEVEPTL